MDREALGETEPVDLSLEFGRIILMINPNSTRRQFIKSAVQELEASAYGDGTRITKLYTSKKHGVNQQLLSDNLEANDLLIVAGGDGTVHEAASIVSKDLPDLAVKLLILPGGNAGDFSYSVHQSDQLPTLSQILNNSQSIAVHPIEIQTESDSAQSDDIAIGYAGFGFTALAAKVLNSPYYRKLPFYSNPVLRNAYELSVAIMTVTNAHPFRIEHKGQVEELTELLAANGRRVAKRLVLPMGLEEDRIFISRLERSRHYQKLTKWGIRVAMRRDPNLRGLFLQEETFSFITRSSVSMQLDGEPQDLEPDTRVLIRRSDTSLDIVKYQPKQQPTSYSPRIYFMDTELNTAR